jgi:hypothetical protein
MKVALCLPFWALLINHTAGNWVPRVLSKLQLHRRLTDLTLLFPVGTRWFVAQAFYTLLTWLPTYMKEVLDFDVHKAGFIAVLPYLALTVVVIVSGFVADLFIGACLTPFHHRLPLAHLSSVRFFRAQVAEHYRSQKDLAGAGIHHRRYAALAAPDNPSYFHSPIHCVAWLAHPSCCSQAADW